MPEVQKRILFFDLMRAFAVLMMVQGHTVHTCLAPEYSTFESPVFTIWHIMRGYTAPVFMFIAGAIFTHLLLKNTNPFFNNIRVKKGFKRFLILLGTGYLLRYPTYKIFDFSGVTEKGWQIFFAVDALHLIAFGILTILFLKWINEKLETDINFLLLFASLFFFGFHFIAKNINWIDFLPLPVASYFYRGTGSLFPLFPWVGYVLAGGLLGAKLTQMDISKEFKKFKFKVLTLALFLLGASLTIKFIFNSFNDISIFYIINRTAVVLLYVFIFSLISEKMSNINWFIKAIGRNTLTIYVIHLVILYGCAWLPGIYKYFGKTYSPVETIAAVIFMEALMLTIVYFKEKKKTKKLTLAEANV